MPHSAQLTWVASTDAVDGYNVYKGTAGAGSEAAAPINGTTLVTGVTYTDTTVLEGDSLSYYVTAKKGAVESLHSNEVLAVILPAAPTNLTITVV
jgi:hypothetical protein